MGSGLCATLDVMAFCPSWSASFKCIQCNPPEADVNVIQYLLAVEHIVASNWLAEQYHIGQDIDIIFEAES